MKKSFKHWTRQELKNNFNIQQTDSLAALTHWTDLKQTELTTNETAFLTQLLHKSHRNLNNWNETELHEKFIIKILELIDFEFEEHNCHTFAERYLSAQIQHISLHGYIDWLVARGFQYPEKPYFFIHEYKPEGAKEIDARGQLLAAMLVAAQFNQTPTQPIYGTLVQGRMWFFVVYEEGLFAETPAYDALKMNDLLAIAQILKKQKQIIENRLKNGD